MVNLNKKTKLELPQMLQNCAHRPNVLHAQEMVKGITKIRINRGFLLSSKWSGRWNSAEVTETLKPFVDISLSFPDNQRTWYTTAGRLHIRRSKADPVWRFVDSDSAIKTETVTAERIFYVGRPGDDTLFVRRLIGDPKDRTRAIEMQGDRSILSVAMG